MFKNFFHLNVSCHFGFRPAESFQTNINLKKIEISSFLIFICENEIFRKIELIWVYLKMAMKIYQLAYHSICSPHINAIDLKDILVKALDFNEKNKITGCLVKYKSEFIQIIESENQEVIHQLFDKIKVDQRHHAVTLLYTGFKSSRDYINWTMGFFNLNTSQVELIAETQELIPRAICN
jgi:hypothetical protein